MPPLPTPGRAAPGGAPTAPQDPAAALWDAHFREPVAAVARARAALDDPASDERTLAWAELTVGWHQLYFTSDPAGAAAYLPDAQRRFELVGDRRGELAPWPKPPVCRENRKKRY